MIQLVNIVIPNSYINNKKKIPTKAMKNIIILLTPIYWGKILECLIILSWQGCGNFGHVLLV